MFETLGKLQEKLDECHGRENEVKQDMQKHLEVIRQEMNKKMEQIKQAYQPQFNTFQEEKKQVIHQKNEIAKSFFEEIKPETLSILYLEGLSEDSLHVWLANDQWKVVITLGEREPWVADYEGQLLLSYYVFQLVGKKVTEETKHLVEEIEQMVGTIKEHLESLPKYRLLTVYTENVIEMEQKVVQAVNLTKMEQKVWKLYAQCKQYEEIGKAVGMTKKGVDNTIQRIRGKMIW